MDFFKSVFADDQELEPSDSHERQVPDHDEDDPNPTPSNPSGAWSFGGLIKTLANKSESVIQTYRRDLEEFGSGLKKETAVIREVASRAVKDFPASLDVGASVAQESLESVGQAIDEIGSAVWSSTAQIISHGKDTILSGDTDSDSSGYNTINPDSRNSQSMDLKRYSRFDAQLHAIQSDVNTYVEEPEDVENFNNWRLGFMLDEKEKEIESLVGENEVMGEIYGKLVPTRIDREGFWCRYFYRVHRLKQAEDARAKLVKRAISGDEEEDLSWDFDEADDGEEKENIGFESKGDSVGDLNSDKKDKVGSVEMDGTSSKGENDKEVIVDSGGALNSEKKDSVDSVEMEEMNLKSKNDKVGPVDESVRESGDKKLEEKLDEKVALDGKADNSDSCKDSDVSVVSSQPSFAGEEDIGWDEIEDIGSIDEDKGDTANNSNRIDLRKRLSTAEEEEEDLSWDIEDDDEPVK